MKERRRNQALQMEPGDRIVFYLTKVGQFAGAVRITSEMFEDREPLWPGKPGSPDPYPWRFHTEPELILDDEDRLPAEDVKDDLEHIRKWPAEHWKLAFQGQLRTVSDADADLLLDAHARGGRHQGMSTAPGEGDTVRVPRPAPAAARRGRPAPRRVARAVRRAAPRGDRRARADRLDVPALVPADGVRRRGAAARRRSRTR